MTENYNYERLVVGQLETNCYLLYHAENRKCIILDPGGESSAALGGFSNLVGSDGIFQVSDDPDNAFF